MKAVHQGLDQIVPGSEEVVGDTPLGREGGREGGWLAWVGARG